MRDPIRPAVASHPAEAAELVSLAISDGDLEAAVAQYERGALLRPWRPAAFPEGPAGAAGSGTLARELAVLMEYRLPLAIRISAVVPGNGVALVLAERQLCGTGPDGQPVDLTGAGGTVVRLASGGTWRIAADAWRLAPAATFASPAPRRFPRAPR